MFKFNKAKKYFKKQNDFLQKPVEERSQFVENLNIKLKEAKNSNPEVTSQENDCNVEVGDFYTFGAYSNHAISLVNHISENIEYWYTDDGTKLWYKHKIGAVRGTWDWAWADHRTKYALEFKIPLNESKAKYVVIALDYFEGEAAVEIQKPISKIYAQDADIKNPPAFNNGKWTLVRSSLYPKSVDGTATFHSRIDFRKDFSFDWNSN